MFFYHTFLLKTVKVFHIQKAAERGKIVVSCHLRLIFNIFSPSFLSGCDFFPALPAVFLRSAFTSNIGDNAKKISHIA